MLLCAFSSSQIHKKGGRLSALFHSYLCGRIVAEWLIIMSKMNYKKLFRLEIGSVLLIILGIVLLLKPDFGSAAIGTIFGWFLVGGGIVGFVIGFLSWPGLGLGEIVISGALLATGVYLLNHPMVLASLLGILLGILLASQGLGALRDALRIKRHGGYFKLGLILGIGMVALGIFLIFSPLTTSRFVMTVAGIIMIVCGLSNLFCHRKATKFIAADSIIDADS